VRSQIDRFCPGEERVTEGVPLLGIGFFTAEAGRFEHYL